MYKAMDYKGFELWIVESRTLKSDAIYYEGFVRQNKIHVYHTFGDTVDSTVISTMQKWVDEQVNRPNNTRNRVFAVGIGYAENSHIVEIRRNKGVRVYKTNEARAKRLIYWCLYHSTDSYPEVCPDGFMMRFDLRK